MKVDEWEKAEKLLKIWLRRSRHGQHSHHEAGKFCRNMHYIVSIPVIIITTIMGTAAFATIEKTFDNKYIIFFGLLSMSAAALSALQTHLKFPEKSEQHKTLGANYGIIRREIETILSVGISERGEPKIVLEKIRSQLDKIAAEGPVVSTRIWNSTIKKLTKKDKDSNRIRIE